MFYPKYFLRSPGVEKFKNSLVKPVDKAKSELAEILRTEASEGNLMMRRTLL